VFDLEPAVEESRVRAASKQVARLLPRLAVAAFFAVIGYTKFDSDPQGEWFQMFERIGLGQWFRYFTGAVQLTGSVLLVFERTLAVGAALLGLTMLGAAFVDAVVLGSPVFIIPLMRLFLVATVWATPS
jgi:putative oxidoreductase